MAYNWGKCSKCSEELKENQKYWFTLNKGGNPQNNYCASCLKSERKELCKSLIIQRKNEDTTNDAICPWCEKKWFDHLGGIGMDYDDIIEHYGHHIHGSNSTDNNPDFQITERERERAKMDLIGNLLG